MKDVLGPLQKEILRTIATPERNAHTPLQIVATQCQLEENCLVDALALDEVGRLVFLFLGPKTEEKWFFSVLDTLSWLDRNVSLLRERFSLPTSAEELPPRFYLISPELPERVAMRLSALPGLDLLLYECHPMELAGEKRLALRLISGNRGATKKNYSRSRFPSWALDPKGAELLRVAVEKVRKIDPEIELDWGPNRLQLHFRGRLLALLYPDSQGLRVLISSGSDHSHPITDYAQLLPYLNAIFKVYIEVANQDLNEKGLSRSRHAFAPMIENGEVRFPSSRPLLTQEEVEAISK